MIEKARVVEVKGNLAKVEVRRVSACGENCANCKGGCAPTNIYIEVINSIGAKQGEYVEIEMSTRTFLAAVLITYGLPLIMLFIGIFSGNALVNNMGLKINNDMAGAILGFIFMALSYIFISKLDKKYNKQRKIKFEIKKILF
ncbi:positive regulator of sigma(E), RseC/MucC [Geosporobacter subterraneus DSM 17957]|uniref:Positive regulator of sigma(E), RseC/MucC n=1 Tax=Geosporobacter subterraneus DSM 17957 TaxID=1121919 RepID=A0A1M6Q0M9_9FIRM|nr:SoxR reducing system RseC family protein [Geosporobacter subterraneus]SHK13779.1 positive regulator of sigma(E), RseC/MucC [Geosporobacter subterraneus DSM 17957]